MLIENGDDALIAQLAHERLLIHEQPCHERARRGVAEQQFVQGRPRLRVALLAAGVEQLQKPCGERGRFGVHPMEGCLSWRWMHSLNCWRSRSIIILSALSLRSVVAASSRKVRPPM